MSCPYIGKRKRSCTHSQKHGQTHSRLPRQPDALKELSESENPIAGQAVGYQQTDINNIRVIPHASELVQE